MKTYKDKTCIIFMTDEIKSMRQCIKSKSSYTLDHFKEKKREHYNKTCITCCAMKKENRSRQKTYSREGRVISPRE